MKRERLFDSAVIGITVVHFLILALTRLIDRDEGFYLLAARLVVEGQIPYIDFFYPQMPLLPYLYGYWMRMFDFSWESARALSGLATSGIGVLLYFYVKECWDRLAGVAAVFIFAIANFAFIWIPTAKTFSFSLLFLFASFILIERETTRASRNWLLIAGALFSFSVQCRLFFAGVLPLFLLLIYFRGAPYQEGLRRVLWFCVGGTVASLPLIILCFRDFGAVLYNNLGYHLDRSGRSEEADELQKFNLLKIIFGFKLPIRDRGVHLPTLLWLLVGYLGWCLYRKKLPIAAAWVALTLCVLNLLPTPTYLQYFSTVAPFLIVTAVAFFREASAIFPRASIAIALLLFARALSIVPDEITRYTLTGQHILGVGNPKRAPWFTFEAMREISEKIDSLTTPGDYAIPLWPGHIVSSHVRVYPRFENHFGFPAGLRVDRPNLPRFKLPTIPYFLRSISERRAKVIITVPGSESVHVRGALQRAKYRLDAAFRGVRIYVREDL